MSQLGRAGSKRRSDGPVVLVVTVGSAGGARAAAAALACAVSDPDRAALLIDLGDGRSPNPTPIATAGARELEERLAAHLPGAAVASRGRICQLTLPPDRDGVEQIAAALPLVRESAGIVHLPPPRLREALEEPRIRPTAVLLRANLVDDRALTALAAGDLMERGLRVAVLKRQLNWPAARAALLGALPSSAGSLPKRLRERLLTRGCRDATHRGQDGQALLLALGGAFALIAAALALVAIAGAVTGKGRAQRAADLAAISAARSMRDDLPRLLAPARLSNGLLNPGHIAKAAYLSRARAAAIDVAEGNGVSSERLQMSFPDGSSFAPVRVRAVVIGSVDAHRIEASAIAEAAAPAMGKSSMPTMASGGGYSGPLAYRTGEGMRPDVAAAFDRMAAAASGGGLTLVVNSGFRSDAEQAKLFAAHPDPTWVAPPGHSLHRCATELDLGPETAYEWLAANASRFGFAQRYSWEAWHYGFTAGPAPCSAAGNAVLVAGGGADGALAGTAVPSFVPSQYRAPLLGAATRWNVSAALLAGQLMAESNFDPNAGSAAGAQGIAQFMPSTAAAYGLRNPYDPVEAIDAQAHLMSDLLHQFGDPSLALAAYNAGPAPVEACGCIPDYPETQAYVSRILALLGGAGALALPTFEVRLVS